MFLRANHTFIRTFFYNRHYCTQTVLTLRDIAEITLVEAVLLIIVVAANIAEVQHIAVDTL